MDTEYVTNTKYATGYPEVGIEIGSEDFDRISLKVSPTIGQRRVKIEYVLKGRNEVNLCIYNIVGQQVIELADEIKSSGRYTEYWDTQTIKSGIYFCCLRTGDESFITKKVIIIK
ncbi:MAG: T9SS type A sorting domain-containing protein [candidate division WOR-3 bacterium]|nr:T9SS type A sorting domain-containing protein [candidate division WOR-3 bacterium]